MRAMILAGLLLAAPIVAHADDAVAGKWKASLGSDVEVNMDVSPDGKWSSETVQEGKTVAQMTGDYKQTAKTKTSGSLVFTPEKSKVTSQHEAPTVEYDTYTLTNNNQIMRLVASGDTMVFHKQQ